MKEKERKKKKKEKREGKGVEERDSTHPLPFAEVGANAVVRSDRLLQEKGG